MKMIEMTKRIFAHIQKKGSEAVFGVVVEWFPDENAAVS